MFPKFIDYVVHIPDKNVPLLSIFLFQIFLYSVKKEMHSSLGYLLLSL